MRKRITFVKWIVSLCLLILVSSSEAGPMGTAFLYQGRLTDQGSPADGEYDFQFTLFDADVVGTQQGSTIDINDLEVIEGYFTVALDFGSGIFQGDARWLEIGVRPGELADPNDYTTLEPRQEMTPTPYALHTRGVFVGPSNTFVGLDAGYYNTTGKNNTFVGLMAGYLNGTGTGNVFIGNQAGFNETGSNKLYIANSSADPPLIYGDFSTGKIGIGTTSPARPLHIQDGQESIRIDRDENCPSVYMVRTAPDDFSTVWNNFGIGTSADGEGSGSFFIADLGTATGGAGNERIHIDDEGNVGIGTTSPAERLHVTGGNLKVGGTGTDNRVFSYSADNSIVAELFAYNGLGGYVGTLCAFGKAV